MILMPVGGLNFRGVELLCREKVSTAKLSTRTTADIRPHERFKKVPGKVLILFAGAQNSDARRRNGIAVYTVV